MENKISITVDWDLEYDEQSLNSRIEDSIVKQATEKYLANLEHSYSSKLEQMLHDQALKIVKGIGRIELSKCNKDGIKETMSMEDFIIKTATESLQVKRDEYGKTGYNARSDQRTPIEWVVKDIISKKSSEFSKALNDEITRIEKEFQDKLKEIVTKTLAPVYAKLVEKLNK